MGWGQTRASDLVRHHLRGESEHRRSRLSEARVLSVTGTGRADRGRRRGRRLQRGPGLLPHGRGSRLGGGPGRACSGRGNRGNRGPPAAVPQEDGKENVAAANPTYLNFISIYSPSLKSGSNTTPKLPNGHRKGEKKQPRWWSCQNHHPWQLQSGHNRPRRFQPPDDSETHHEPQVRAQ